MTLKFTAAMLLVAASCGCGGAPASTRVDVSGAVTMDGQPLAGAEVKFLGTKASGYGKTRADGKFDLVQGVDPGTYKVVISKIEGQAQAVAALPEGLDAGQLEAIQAAEQMDSKAPKAKPPRELIPADYSNADLTKLSFEVPADGTKTADFKITSQ